MIKFIKYDGIKGYIELMKNDVKELDNPDVKNIELCYSGKDIKAVLDYITSLQEENERLNYIINEFELWLKDHSIVDYNCSDIIVHEQLALNAVLEYLQMLRGDK